MPDMASGLQARHGKIKNEFPWENNGLHPMAPNDETAASVSLSADILGNIRTQTLRAFTSAEMERILANIP